MSFVDNPQKKLEGPGRMQKNGQFKHLQNDQAYLEQTETVY